MVQDKLLFEDLSCFSTGGFNVYQTVMVCTISVEGGLRKFLRRTLNKGLSESFKDII